MFTPVLCDNMQEEICFCPSISIIQQCKIQKKMLASADGNASTLILSQYFCIIGNYLKA